MSIVTIEVDQEHHAHRVLDRFYEMRKEKKLCDFVIRVGSEEIYVHKHALCAASDYFDDLMFRDTEEKRSGVLELHSDSRCVNILIDYIYGRKVVVPTGKFEEMMYLAKVWKLNKLADAISSILVQHLDLETFFAAKAVTAMHPHKTLEKKCEIFCRLNFALIAEKEDFGKLDKNFVKEKIRLKSVNISEEKKLDAVLRWIKYEPGRSKYLTEMLKFVDLKLVPLEYRQRLIEEEPVINSNEECSLSFSLSLLDTMNITLLTQHDEESGRRKSAIVLFDGTTWCLQQYNPKDGSLVRKHEILEEMRIIVSVVSLHEHIYVLTGNRSVYRLKYADDEAAWERLPDMLESHGVSPPAVVLLDRIYVVGGDIGSSTGAVEVYDPELSTWVYSVRRPVKSIASGTLAYEERIYCFGGYLDGEVSNKVAIFDHLSMTWRDTAPMKDAKTDVSPVGLNGKIYAVGGSIGTKHTRTVECYDIATESWTTVRRLKRPRSNPSVMVISGSIYVFGGAKTDSMYEKYDDQKNEWSVEEIAGVNLQLRQAVRFDFG